MAKATDPVCGMTVDTSSAAAVSTYAGQTYYFCSTACKKEFDEQPSRFVGKAASPADASRPRPEVH